MQKETPHLESAGNAPERSRLRHPAACRMRSGRDFSRTYRDGVRVRGAHILLVAVPRLNPGPPRLGLSVGRKYSKKAVVRNRCRRVFREAFRLARPDLPAFDFILIPMGRPRPSLRNPDCRDELIALARKAEDKWHRRRSRA